jgi:hypothetical protein
MVARKVAARLKPNSLARFANLMECEILPWLREQQGFLDLITLAGPDGREVATISFWEYPANAQTYHSCAYPEALKILEELLDGAPCMKTFEVVGSTFQNVAVPGSPQAENLSQEPRPGQIGYPYETSF